MIKYNFQIFVIIKSNRRHAIYKLIDICKLSLKIQKLNFPNRKC